MQPQGHMQMVVNQVDYGMNPQASLDAPRWQWLSGRQVLLEPDVPQHVLHGLQTRGHQVTVQPNLGRSGRARSSGACPAARTSPGASRARTAAPSASDPGGGGRRPAPC